MTKTERDNLIVKNRFIPYHVYGKLKGIPAVQRLGLQDAVGEGMLTLIRTADWYDPDHPEHREFRYCAWMNIKNAILDAARKFLPIAHPRGTDFSSLGFTSKETVLNQITEQRPSHETEVDEKEEKENLLSLVRAAADKLPPTQKTVLYGRYLEGKSLRQLAKELGVSGQTVYNEERRAIEEIQDRLGIPITRYFPPVSRFRTKGLAELVTVSQNLGLYD